MNIVVKMLFGSRLYGTNTPDSDTDYKGIYLPSKEECYLNRISRSINHTTKEKGRLKNTSEDIDQETFSLQYFIKLAIRGEMIVLDMLHAPDSFIIKKNHMWDDLRKIKEKFYSKELFGYLGYIRRQTSKYGIKGSRLKAMFDFREVLLKGYGSSRLYTLWDKLPINEFSMYVTNPKDDSIKMYECCSRQFPETITINYALEIVTKLYDSYGERAKKAELNEGIDWKAVSHAFRASLQLQEIYKTGNLMYPLKDAEYIRDIKQGKFHYKNDRLAEKLEDLLNEVEQLAKDSSYPEKVDVKFFDKFILDCYKD